MAQARAPRLSQEECEQFLKYVRTRNPRADALLQQYTDYCFRITSKMIEQGFVEHRPRGSRDVQKTYLPGAILREIRHAKRLDETTGEPRNAWVEDIAQAAMLVFSRKVQTGSYRCQGHQVTTYLYAVVANVVLHTAEKVGSWVEHEVSGLPQDLFASGRDLANTIYTDKRKKDPSPDQEQSAGDSPRQQEPAAQQSAAAATDIQGPSDENDSEPSAPEPDRFRPKQDVILDLIAAEETRVALRRCVEALPHLQRNLITLMLRDEKPTEMARRFSVTPPRITELKKLAFARLRHCLWRRTLLEHVPRMEHLVEDLDPSIGIHYARGLVDGNYGKRCWAGVQRALDTPEPALLHLIERLLTDRQACGLDNYSLADLALLLSPAQQRVLVLALWSTEVVVIDPEGDRVRLKPSADGQDYRAPDELPPV